MQLFETLTTLYPASQADARQARNECLSADGGLTALLRRLQGAADERDVQVNVSTMHAAKGRQWEGVVVYEPGASGRLPDEAELAEERRLRYVALTRSTEHLAVLVHPDVHPAYQHAFEPRFMGQLTRLNRLMTAGHLQPVDVDWIADLRTRWPTLRLYLERFGHPYGPWTQSAEQPVETNLTAVRRRPLS